MGIAKKISVSGLEFPNIQDAAAHFGVHKSTVARRLRSGWTEEQALGIVERPKRVAHNQSALESSLGVFSSIRQASEVLGIEEGTIANRLRLGWSVDQALGAESRERKKRTYTSYQFRGKNYPSLAALCRDFGKSRSKTAARLKAGWSLEQALGLEDPPPRFRDHYGHARSHIWKKPTEVEGKLAADSLSGTYRVYLIRNRKNGKQYVGLTTNALNVRFNGHKRQATLGTKGKLYNAMRKYGFDAFEISLIRDDASSIQELQEQEVAEIEARNCIANGYNTAVGGGLGTPMPIEIDGEIFSSQTAAALHFGIDQAVFNIRLKRLGWSPEEAAELGGRRKYGRHKLIVEGSSYSSLKSAAEDHGLEYKTVHRRVKSGWSIKQALGLAHPPSRTAHNAKLLKSSIGEFKSAAEAETAAGIKAGTIRFRLQAGWTVDQAIGVAPPPKIERKR